MQIVVKDPAGRLSEFVLSPEDLEKIEVLPEGTQWTFDGDPDDFKLALEAHRIRLAHLFDPYMAVHASAVTPLPHQIQAVYGTMLDRQPLRFLLADDPGAGKTIMSGLLLKELMTRGVVRRAMIVAPGSLVEQWQDELAEKFGLEFTILTNDLVAASRTGNPWAEQDLLICRLDHLARNEEYQQRVATAEWDLVIIDEAHKCSAHYQGSEPRYTKRYHLAELLGQRATSLLMLTATPHSGHDANFHLFLALLDADRFAGRPRDGARLADASDLWRRAIKEDLKRFDGSDLFPKRIAKSLEFELSTDEKVLYAAVTDYVREEFNRADRLGADGKRRAVVGFALTTLQRRLASSPEAIYQSLRRRRERLEKRLVEEGLIAEGHRLRLERRIDDEEDLEDLVDELPESESEELVEEVVDQATAAQTVEELRAEVRTLTELEKLAESVRASKTDRKWEELRELLMAPQMKLPEGTRRKIIVFTEHKDTLTYLRDRIGAYLGDPDTVVVIHGGLGREERKKAQERFTQDVAVSVLVATDAAGEGINLQRANLLVNYDLPWNPNRIEQRFGRIHRIGQEETCFMWNLIARDTKEGEVFVRLFEKLEAINEVFEGKVFDVLGKAFTDRSLRSMLLEAIRFSEDERALEVKLDRDFAGIAEQIRELAAERGLASAALSAADRAKMRELLAEAEAKRLQPLYVQGFFLRAFERFGGKLHERELGRFQIRFVPNQLRDRDRLIGGGTERVLDSYERVTFDPDLVRVSGKPLAALLAPGHPLLDSLLDLVLERYRSVMHTGTVLVDRTDEKERPHVLVALQHDVTDGRRDRAGARRVISRELQFVAVDEGGEGDFRGSSWHLDLTPPDDDEQRLIDKLIGEPWLRGAVDRTATEIALREAVPAHRAAVETRVRAQVAKERVEVEARLRAEINLLDHRAARLEEDIAAGKTATRGGQTLAANLERTRRMADEFHARLEQRRRDLAAREEIAVSSPTVLAGALVVPQGWLERARDQRVAAESVYAREVERTERYALEAVKVVERGRGRSPREMARNNPGWDITSIDADGDVWHIEVKGRRPGARDVFVTTNEVLHSQNRPHRYVFALVEVHDDGSTVVHYRPGALPTGELIEHLATCPFLVDPLLRGAEVAGRFTEAELGLAPGGGGG